MLKSINWKLRFQNKVTLTAIVLQVISIFYMALRILGIEFFIDQQALIDLCMMIIDLVSLLGIVVDPTTNGASDSDRALSRKKLGDD